MVAAGAAAAILVICPGLHGPELTAGFVAALEGALALASPDGGGLGGASRQSQAIGASQGENRAQDSGGDRVLAACWTLPPELPPYSPRHVENFVQAQWQRAVQSPASLAPETPLIWLGFSAGVVGAIAAARQWQRRGGQVRRFIAFDGWGVPLGRAFPCYRFSHDRFTALSCEALGRSQGYFYAAPAVDHLSLWRSPDRAWGHWRQTGWEREDNRCTAIEALARLILHRPPT